MKKHLYLTLSFILIFGFLLTACEPLGQLLDQKEEIDIEQTQVDPEALETTEPGSPVVETEVPIPDPTATPEAIKPTLWIEPGLPDALTMLIPNTDQFERVERETDADFRIAFSGDELLSQWVYALVAPFKTVQDVLSFVVLQSIWQGGGHIPATLLVVDEKTAAAMTALLGTPGPAVQVLPSEDLLSHCEQDDRTWAIVPFENLVPQWKVIALDGQSPIRKDFDPAGYPLSLPIGLSVDEALKQDNEKMSTFEPVIEAYKQALALQLPGSNRQADKLTTVMMTGVTALVRATAKQMEMNGVLYPGEDVREVLREADITHVSNEIPFYSQCPPPQWTQERLVFCSDPKYMELLLDIGTDVVDLTGDHFADFGAEAMHETLDMYDEHKIPYFGGGRDINDATQPVKFEVNGNKIAFLGCNGKEPGYARVSETNPGAYLCNMDDMVSQVQELVAEGYLPIFTFQHVEYYHWGAEPYLMKDFRRIAEAGAVVVSGSQGHQPHAYEYYDGAWVHYGLGNLFFDQYGTYDDTDKAFLDRIVFYDGKMIGVELLTVQFFDWAKPTWTNAEQREFMLKKLFEVSDWD